MLKQKGSNQVSLSDHPGLHAVDDLDGYSDADWFKMRGGNWILNVWFIRKIDDESHFQLGDCWTGRPPSQRSGVGSDSEWDRRWRRGCFRRLCQVLPEARISLDQVWWLKSRWVKLEEVRSPLSLFSFSIWPFLCQRVFRSAATRNINTDSLCLRGAVWCWMQNIEFPYCTLPSLLRSLNICSPLTCSVKKKNKKTLSLHLIKILLFSSLRQLKV